MELTFRRKLKTLTRIVKKYVSYKPRKCVANIYMNFDKVVIHIDIISGTWKSKHVEFPKNEINENIKRYRDLLRYEKQKMSENKKKKQINMKNLVDFIANSDKEIDLKSKLDKIML